VEGYAIPAELGLPKDEPRNASDKARMGRVKNLPQDGNSEGNRFIISTDL